MLWTPEMKPLFIGLTAGNGPFKKRHKLCIHDISALRLFHRKSGRLWFWYAYPPSLYFLRDFNDVPVPARHPLPQSALSRSQMQQWAASRPAGLTSCWLEPEGKRDPVSAERRRQAALIQILKRFHEMLPKCFPFVRKCWGWDIRPS